MARYQVVQKSFINGVFYNPDIDPSSPVFVEYDGIPGPNLKPVDEEGTKAKAKFKETTKQDAARLAKAAEGVEDFAAA